MMLSEERLDAAEQATRLSYAHGLMSEAQHDATLDLIAAARRERELRELVDAAGPWPNQVAEPMCRWCRMWLSEGVPHAPQCPAVALAAWLAEHGQGE